MLSKQLESLNLHKVCPAPYKGTYVIIKPASLMAEQVRNRDSASWKKAEHIFFDTVQPDFGKAFLPFWQEFGQTNPDGESSTQSLYVPVGKGVYVKYNVRGDIVATGTIEKLFS